MKLWEGNLRTRVDFDVKTVDTKIQFTYNGLFIEFDGRIQLYYKGGTFCDKLALETT